MSLLVTVVSTANRKRSYRPSELRPEYGILGNLSHAAQIFSKPTLVIVGADSTIIYNPATITRIEFETNIDLHACVPAKWLEPPALFALPADEAEANAMVEEQRLKRFDFYFVGGDKLSTWLDTSDAGNGISGGGRIAGIFEQPVIPYRLSQGGIGIINPANLTRTRANAPLHNPPVGAWHASEEDD